MEAWVLQQHSKNNKISRNPFFSLRKNCLRYLGMKQNGSKQILSKVHILLWEPEDSIGHVIYPLALKFSLQVGTVVCLGVEFSICIIFKIIWTDGSSTVFSCFSCNQSLISWVFLYPRVSSLRGHFVWNVLRGKKVLVLALSSVCANLTIFRLISNSHLDKY